ncbi:MAG: cell division protein FtsI (penicillin-binding protein 3) [Parcubacteria bacterium C7867-005]|nr:MAG: cell division protein FtsI (penicillin-binding protein 3) [Parcubacteria bacterium C7867-005]
MKEASNRLRFLSIAVIVFALVLISKLYWVQIVSGDRYEGLADHQYVAGSSYFDRGSIFFSAKDGSTVPAATLKTGFILAINPQILSKDPDIGAVYEKINNITPIDKDSFLSKINKESDPYEEIENKLSQDVADQISGLKIKGVSVYKEKWRIYPGDSMAAQTVGFIGYKGDELAGRYGLERFYEPQLGRSGDEAFVNFFAEIFSNIKKRVVDGGSLEGDIVTTIEPTVESYLEAELKKVNDKYHSEFTGGIVINPKNGEIYAIGMDPTFNPNDLKNENDPSVFRNKFVEDRYEMGSIIKPLTVAAGLDSGAITPKTTYKDPGCMTLNKKTFCNYDLKSHGSLVPMQTILSKSLNTGVAFIVNKMGKEVFADYMFKFGLATTTGIDLPNEGHSLVSNLNSPRDLEHAQASFGQGIALTPIITVRALSALANGGVLINPHLVKEIKHKIGTADKIEFEESQRVLKPETTEEISRMLTEVVDRALKNGTVRLENYSIAAKTGTAQIAKSGGGGYYEDRYLHSFFGYFPSFDPKFLIFLYTFHPKEVKYASETLTDTFINMAKFLINYYDIPPDREAPPPATVKI